ncbi:MAG: hypothetical protein M1827_003306 [Pycnora praestabilis]|nr:MAG: hypothetical protein M1827_003306 [Pycnora praestabilis]
MSHARNQPPSSPYSASNVHGDSSSRAITSNPSAEPQNDTPRASNNHHTTESHTRRIGLGDHFNEPLRRHIWTSKRRWTKGELERERQEFFETRVSGRQEIWRTLHMVVGLMDTELETAQGVLDAAGVTVPTGDLVNGAYDEIGNFYQVPEQCVSDPMNVIISTDPAGAAGKGEDLEESDEDELERRREEKGKGVMHAAQMFTVKARLSDRGGPDVQITMSKEQNIRVLSRKVQEEAGLPGKGKVKIAYMGKILKDSEPLHTQGWKEGHVVNALVFQ